MPGWKREEEGCSAYGGWAAELREERNPFSSAEGGKVSFPNQRFLVIKSLKSPFRLTSADFAVPIIRFLHITGPIKLLEGCAL